MQFGEFEIVAHKTGRFVARESDPMQAAGDLLLPPLVRRPAVAVGHSEQWRDGQFLGCGACAGRDVGFHHRHGLPAVPASVLEPHRGPLRLGAARVAHRIDIDVQRIGQAALHLIGGHVDQEGRQRPGAPLDVRSGRVAAPPLWCRSVSPPGPVVTIVLRRPDQCRRTSARGYTGPWRPVVETGGRTGWYEAPRPRIIW